MKMLTSGDVSAHFPSVLKDVRAGNEITITVGRKNEAVAVIVPYEKWKPLAQRKLGTLENKMSVSFTDDFAMTDEDLVSL